MTPRLHAALPPGGKGLPWVGEALAMLFHPFAFYEQRSRRHGPIFRTRLMKDDLVCFVGPEAFAVFNDERYFSRQQACLPKLRQFFTSDVVTFFDGPRHVVRKRLLLQAFDLKNLEACLPLIDRMVRLRLEGWSSAREIFWTEELGKLAFALTNVLFAGADPETGNEPLRRTLEAFQRGIYSAPIRLPFTTFSRGLRARKVLLQYFRQAIASHRSAPRQDLLSALLAAEVEGVRLSDEEVALELLHSCFAAYSGLRGLFVGLCYALTLNPQPRERLHAEVESSPSESLSLEGLNSLPYLDQTIKEVKRFYPMVPATLFARTVKPVRVGDFEIPAGWLAVGCPHSTLSDPHIFKEPGQFRPERFSPGELQPLQEKAFVPHGGGPLVEGHRCPGEQLATVLMKVLAVRLLQGFMWKAPRQDLRLDLRHIPPLPRGRLRVQLQHAHAERPTFRRPAQTGVLLPQEAVHMS